MKKTNLTLPEWAWIDGGDHEKGGNPIQGREILMHIRSASVMEVLDGESTELNEDTIKYGFNYINSFGLVEPKLIALHYSALLDADEDYEKIIEILKGAVKWYCDWCDWEDANIRADEFSQFN